MNLIIAFQRFLNSSEKGLNFERGWEPWPLILLILHSNPHFKHIFLYNPHQNQYEWEWILFHNQESWNYKLTSWMPVFLLKQHPLEVSITVPSFIPCSLKKMLWKMNPSSSSFNRKGTPYGRNFWTSAWYVHFKQLTTEVWPWWCASALEMTTAKDEFAAILAPKSFLILPSMDKDLIYSHLKRAGKLVKYHIRAYSLSPMRLPITVPCPTHQVRILKAGKILVGTMSQTSIWYPNIVVAVFLMFWICMRCIFSLNTSTKLILKSQGMICSRSLSRW